ncbi:MAG TPA: hypothetical protein VF058_05030 [Actinomycetota bacterium]
MADRTRTVHLGQFTWEAANDIAGALEEAGIVWWYKQPGFFSQIWEHGIRLFVDRERLAEAREIARRVIEELESPTES